MRDKVSQKAIFTHKVGTDENLADALTKGVEAAAIQKHMIGVGIELASDRHGIAPTLDIQAKANVKLEDA